MAYTTIKKPSDYFNTKLYTGTGSSQAVTGVGFQPDWLWIKNRGTADENIVFDSVRGVGKRLLTDGTQSELTTTNQLSSFDSDGFTVPGLSANTGASSNNYVAWNWLADNTSGSSNTSGSITSTVSANTTSGFSIVSWTGTGSAGTIGHGLGAVPKMIIIKDLSNTRDWFVYHASVGNNKRLKLNDSVAEGASTVFNNTTPTSSVFSIDGSVYVNNSGSNYIAYCFAEKQGYSKFGNYFGNGNADGTFVYTGFKPAFIMIKDADNLEQWFIFDNKRNTSNVSKNLLYASDSAAETTSGANQIDILSNGFKMRSTNNGTNRSGGEGFTYMAFAEEPLVGDNPATAR